MILINTAVFVCFLSITSECTFTEGFSSVVFWWMAHWHHMSSVYSSATVDFHQAPSGLQCPLVSGILPGVPWRREEGVTSVLALNLALKLRLGDWGGGRGGGGSRCSTAWWAPFILRLSQGPHRVSCSGCVYSDISTVGEGLFIWTGYRGSGGSPKPSSSGSRSRVWTEVNHMLSFSCSLTPFPGDLITITPRHQPAPGKGTTLWCSHF